MCSRLRFGEFSNFKEFSFKICDREFFCIFDKYLFDIWFCTFCCVTKG